MLRTYIFFFFLLATIEISAQSFKGFIYDQISNRPIINVNVYVKNSRFGDRTNKQGRFNIKLSPKEFTIDTLVISHISYNTISKINPDISVVDTIFLSLKTNVLNEIQLIENRKLKRNLNFEKLAPLLKNIHSFASLLIHDEIYIFGGDLTFNVNTYRKALSEFDYSQGPPGASMKYFFDNVFFQVNLLFRILVMNCLFMILALMNGIMKILV